MIRYLQVELLKLHRSLALVLVAAAPACVAALSSLFALNSRSQGDWMTFASGTSGIWAFFMLPMSVTALTVLMGQMEHGPRMWNHILALPLPRSAIFITKALVLFGLVALMMAILFISMYFAGTTVNAIEPNRLAGSFPTAAAFRLLTLMFLASLLMCVIQLWTALRFRSFVPPLILGIAGTLVSVAATSASQGKYFPWLLPVQALSNPANFEMTSIILGCVGGLLLLVPMVLDLSRKEF